MILIVNAVLLLVAFTLTSNGVAIPIRNQKPVSSGNGGIVVPNDLAQPVVQRSARDSVAAMELPVLSGNITEEKGRVSHAVRKAESENHAPAVELRETNHAQKDMPGPHPRDETLEKTSTSSPESLAANRPNKQAAMKDGSNRDDHSTEAKTVLFRRAEKIIVEDKKAFSSTIRRPSPTATPHTTKLSPTSSKPASTLPTSSPTPTAPPPPPYTPGTCHIHVRQTYHPTCQHFNHHDCTRINSTISLSDASSPPTLLATANTTLTYDGINTFSLASALPYPVTFAQLAIVQGVHQELSSRNRKNYWPMRMGYGKGTGEDGRKGQEWRNDDERMCRWGEWEGFLVNRDFDCWFDC
jgi:hypothetical protein